VGEYAAARPVSISLSPGTGKSHLRDCPTEPSARDKSCLRINTLPGDAGSKQASAAVCAGARDGMTVLISGRNGDRRFLSQSAEQFATELVAQVRKRYGRLRSLRGEKLLVWTAREATKFRVFVESSGRFRVENFEKGGDCRENLYFGGPWNSA
jgi:hypothetical protein